MSTDRAPSPEWYKDAFRFDYLRVYPHRNDEEAYRQVDFLMRNVDCPPPKAVFDLGCGDGRHAVELARRGYQVTGLDLSEELLTKARSRNEEESLGITFIQGDMREIPYENAFDLLVNFFTSFGYFDKDEENARVLTAIACALRPGGRFLMDYLNRDHVVHTLVPHDRKTIENAEVEQTRWITGDPDKAGDHVRINKRVAITDEQGTRTYDESVRMYTLDELSAMLSAAGLHVDQVFGDFDGQPISQETPRAILIGTK